MSGPPWQSDREREPKGGSLFPDRIKSVDFHCNSKTTGYTFVQLRIWNFLIARTAKGEPIEREIGRESPSLPPQRSCGFSCSPFHLEARVTENDPRTLLAIFSFLPPTPPLSFFLPSLSLSLLFFAQSHWRSILFLPPAHDELHFVGSWSEACGWLSQVR